MLKKGLSLLLVFALIVLFPGQTSAIIIGDDTATINTSARIAELYDLRAELTLNYEENIEAIEEIDAQLELLGVETLTNAEVLALMGQSGDAQALPMINLPQITGQRWTSERVYTVYCGVRLQYQIVRCVPSAQSSDLISNELVTRKIYGTYGPLTLAINAFKMALSPIAGYAFGIDAELGEVESLFGILSLVHDSLSPYQSIGEVDGTYRVAMSSFEEYIFVKYDGASDDDQVVCYAGNQVNFGIGVNAMVWEIDEDTEGYYPISNSKDYNGNITSQYYNQTGAVNHALETFFYSEHLAQRPRQYNFKLNQVSLFELVPAETAGNTVPPNYWLTVPTSGCVFY